MPAEWKLKVTNRQSERKLELKTRTELQMCRWKSMKWKESDRHNGGLPKDRLYREAEQWDLGSRNFLHASGHWLCLQRPSWGEWAEVYLLEGIKMEFWNLPIFVHTCPVPFYWWLSSARKTPHVRNGFSINPRQAETVSVYKDSFIYIKPH